MDIRPIDANALHALYAGPFVQTYAECRKALDDAPTLSLNTLRDAICEDAVAHGLWEDDDELSDDLLDDCYDLIRDEVGELDGAIEEWVRTGYHNHFAEELADVIIVSLSVAGRLGIDIDKAIRKKMAVNKERPWKHGKED